MEPAGLLLAQSLTLIGLIAASCVYAGIVRRRHERWIEWRAEASAGESAVERVENALFLGRIDRTFVRSAYLPDRGDPGNRRRSR